MSITDEQKKIIQKATLWERTRILNVISGHLNNLAEHSHSYTNRVTIANNLINAIKDAPYIQEGFEI